MKRLLLVFMLAALLMPIISEAQYSKPVYISLPGPGNVQHLAYAVAKEKKFCEEFGLTNVNIVSLCCAAMR